jgi:hypothetical protein
LVGSLAILRAIRRLVWRDLNTIFSISLNNLFLFILPIATGGLLAIAPFLFLFGVLLLFPLCSDPLNKVPSSRLNLWPLSRWQSAGLRVGSLALSPAFWIATLLLCARAGLIVALLFLLVAAAVQGLTAVFHYAAGRLPMLNPLRIVPRFRGRLGGIVRIAARQIFSVLDFYASAILSLVTLAYRLLSPHPDPAAFPLCAILVALGLSTYPQQMFGLDSKAGVIRYRLLPLRGWQILLAKDLAYFSILTVLVLPLDLGVGLTFGLAAVAIGRYPSLRLRSTQKPWRFVSGELRFGVAQIIAGTALGLANSRIGWWFFAGAAAAYVGSLAFGGWWWDHHQEL